MDYMGVGIYSYAEASRLIGVSTSRVRGWFEGWPGGGPALFQSELGGKAVSFLDLIDASVAAILRDRVSIPAMRKIKAALSNLWSTSHPFSRQEFYTDGKGSRIFVEIVRSEGGDPEFIEILERQHAMPKVLKPILEHVRFNPRTHYAQKMPLGRGVVLDPRRRYGKPIVEDCGMPTQILYDAYNANHKNAEMVADWYGVSRQDVESAITFEINFGGIAA